MSGRMESAIASAFFMKGLIESGAQNCVRTVRELCKYAEDAAAMVNEHEFHHGKYADEVCIPFGNWFGQHTINTGNMPAMGQCYAWLINKAEASFAQGAGVS